MVGALIEVYNSFISLNVKLKRKIGNGRIEARILHHEDI